MLKVSEEVVALRSESNRVLQQELLQGPRSIASRKAAAQEYDAKGSSSMSQLNIPGARRFIYAMGSRPNDTLTSMQH